MATTEEIKLGQKVKCKITGFEGIVDHIADYMNSCKMAGVISTELKDGKVADTQMFDVPQLKIIDEKPIFKVTIPKQRVPMGVKARDPITGFEGVVISRAIYINGCSRIALREKYDPKSEKGLDSGHWFPEQQIEIIEEKPVVKESKKDKGGPAPKIKDHTLKAR